MGFLRPTTHKPLRHELVSAGTSNIVIADNRLSHPRLDKEDSTTALRASRSFTYIRTTEPTATSVISPIEDDFPTPRPYNVHKRPSSMSDDYFVSPIEESPKNARPVDFDDMYDATDDEIDRDEPLEIDVIPPDDEDAPPVIVRRPSTRSAHTPIRTDSLDPTIARNRYPSLAIPKGGRWSSIQGMKMGSPIPPTPPPKIPISPSILSLLAQDAPNSTAPPSLDGSLTSDQLANSTAPPTPSVRTPEIADGDPAADWSGGGIQLHPDALATLNVLPSNGIGHEYEDQIIEEQGIEERVIETPHPSQQMQQMQQIPNHGLRRSSAIRISPPSRRSLNGLAQVNIPSPSTFFSQLASPTRNTWCPTSPPPSSGTAEKFYTCPWNGPIEQVIEVEEDASDGPPTARPIILQGAITEEPLTEEPVSEGPPGGEPASEGRPSEGSAVSEDGIVEEHIKTPEAGMDFDQKYRQELKHSSMINLDRTSQWLSTQSSYLAALKDIKEEMHATMDEESTKAETEVVDRASISTKKSVRFSLDIDGQAGGQGQDTTVARKESAYYRAFQKISGDSSHMDAFVYRRPRSDALRAQRTCQPVAHILQLSAHYELKRRSVHEGATPEEKQEARTAKEIEAMDQINLAMWNVMATVVLNQGKLLISPAATRLAQAGKAPATSMHSERDRTRILDLGGQPICDWAWHCARQFPNTKIYTAFPKATTNQLTNPAAIRGPHNHRSVSIPQLFRLPFARDYFDVIVVRSIHMFLKAKNMVGAPREFDDEYDLCLRECYRCLKPGGYLEFSLLDADIMNAGPLGSAMSVEFSFRLKTRGYDPYPTRAWTGRLQKAGFGTIKRAWVFLPMGAPIVAPSPPSKRDVVAPEKPEEGVEETRGNTAEVASVTGLVGSWAWEKWIVKLHTEVGKGGPGALDGVNAVLEEGRKSGAGWRSLSGYARKPLRGT
jgi:SAM-dependent methyltransferase